ncbi:MAG: aromatic aminobenezylarsenical efflux permease ArsG family transporter [Planctomycetota bacterium]|jgi:cytochrome c-type biogenesis protein|nr:aromatic aminobenezylarsenical efflux permease ArsG family transporter [Planctomycetota bacterium]
MSWAAIGIALWLGVMTAISPCPLAANIAAISFIGKDVENRRRVLLAGLLYTIGRSLTYVAIAVILVWGLASAGDLSRSLQRYGAAFLGPILVTIGLLLLGWLGGTFNLQAGSNALRLRLAKAGYAGPVLLGVLFALSFCPVSAGLYFGGLLPLATKEQSPVFLPVLFGVSTAIPVVFFALLVAFAANRVGRAFDNLRRVESVVQVIFGAGLIITGIYYSLTYTYQLF